jgi:hypothetical protein
LEDHQKHGMDMDEDTSNTELVVPADGSDSGTPPAPKSEGGGDELAGLQREEEAARRELLAQRKASLMQRQQAARSTATTGASSGSSGAGEDRSTPPGDTVGARQIPREGGSKMEQKQQKDQPVRAEAVENAVRFLEHPKVKASPLGKRLAFLEHKGLNDAEIALALKRANISSDDVKLAMDAANSPTAGPPLSRDLD